MHGGVGNGCSPCIEQCRRMLRDCGGPSPIVWAQRSGAKAQRSGGLMRRCVALLRARDAVFWSDGRNAVGMAAGWNRAAARNGRCR